MRKFGLLLVLMIVAVGLILTGCSKAKGQAETALKAAEQAISESAGGSPERSEREIWQKRLQRCAE